MNFSARNTRLAIVSSLSFMLIISCLIAGVRLRQRRQSATTNNRPSSGNLSITNQQNLPTADGGADYSSDTERSFLIRRLKEKRAELAEGLYDKPNEAMEFFRLKRLAADETEIPAEKYLLAYRQMELMSRHSFGDDKLTPSLKQSSKNLALPSWTSLGPGNVGGRTRAIVINPTTPTTMYAAGVAGGVWKTTNGGTSWSPTSDLMANLAVGSLTMDPANPNILYAGTGEGFANGDAVRGAGIFKTTDGGANWTQLANTTSTDFYYVNDMAISPVNSNRVYAATRTGVWRTTDGGTNWTKVLNATSVGSTTTAINGGCLDLAIRTDKPTDYIFASCGNFEQARIFRNTDAGAAGTWTQVHTEASAGRTSLAIAPSNQDIIYALSAELDGTFANALHAVFRSTSSGDAGTWEARVRNSDPNKLNASIMSFVIGAFATNCGLDTTNFFGAQSWYDNVIAVDPTDPQRVWVGGVDVMRSDDGAANWGMATHVYQSRTNPQYAHPDQHAIVFHPQYNGTSNQTVFIGNDGGIFRSDNARAVVATGNNAPCNAAATAVNWTSLNNGYGVTQFYHGSVYPNGATYFGGAQDNGTTRGSDSAGANAWSEIWPGDGGYTAIDPTNTNNLFTANTGISVVKSTNGGTTFNSAVNGISDSGLFITPYVMDPSNPQRLFLGGRLFIWRTNNGATSWQQASAITPGSGSVSAITVSPTNSNFALAGMSDGYILRTDQALTSTSTTTWPSTQPRTGYVSSLAFDPTNKDIAYATYSTFGGVHVWKTVNAGTNWTGLNGSGTGILPDVPVHSIVVDPTNTMRLYIGTDVGVFSTIDGGVTWAVENTNFANVITEWLTINSTSSTTQLFAFTHGRGAWRVTANPTGCNYVLTPASQTFTDAGGNGTISVTAEPNGCNWTAVSNAAWLTINSGASGTTNGTIAFSVAAHTRTTPRTGTITAAGKTFTVTQNGCTTIAAAFQYFEAAGGTGSIPVTATAGCTWTTTGNPSWVTINSGAAGTGNGAVAFTVAANTSTSSRQTVLTVAGQSFTINQGGLNGSCAVTPIVAGQAINGSLTFSDCYSLQRGQFFSADRYSFTGSAGQRVAIRADSSTVDTFLYLIDPTGAVVASNDDGDYRTDARIPAGTAFYTLPSSGAYQIEVTAANSSAAAGAYTVSLSNGSANCSYAAAPAEQNFAAAGGNGSIAVTVTGSGCDWTATSNAAWVTINSGATGSGNGTTSFSVAANTGFSRTAYVIVAGQLVTINQLGTGATAIGKWVTQASGTTNQLNHVFFLDDNQGWTVGANSTARSTSNGGSTTWNGFTVGGSPQNYNSVRFLDTSNGWVGGEKITAITSNGGSSFGRLEFTTGTRNRLFPVNTTSAFGAGERSGGGFHANSFILLAFGFGQETSTLLTLNTLRDIYFPNPASGWSVGDKGQIFRLTKGGGAFDEQTGITTQNLNGIFALDLCTAWAVGDGGVILKTTNAGQIWTPQTSGVTTALRDIHFNNSDRGWAVGDGGVILVTWDGGATWAAEPSGVTADLRSVHTNSINAVYAVGANGTIVKRALCTYTLSATTASFAEAGGSGSVNVTSVAGCPWTATSNASWITINSGTPGSGNGTLNFSVAANTGLARTGTLTVAGQSYTVNQAVACPTVTGFTPPRSGVAGSVVITGTNFTEVTSVKFTNNITAQFTVNSPTQLTATVPAGAVTGPITISKTGCGDVQTASFIVCNPITINPVALSPGTVGLAYNQALTASGGTAAYGYTVTTGALPSGLTLSTGGTISGAPIVSGTFNLTVTATDANGCTGARAYSLIVACPTITLSPTTLPNGLVGSAYNQTVTAAPALNTGSYSYAVTTGNLPAGLSLNPATGAITGNPTTGGTSNFTITALGLGCSGNQTYSLFIQPLCPTVTGINPTSGVVGASVTITGTNLAGVDSVKFASGVSATFTAVSNTQITATVPTGAVTGAITVSKQFCSDAASAAYTVLPTPTITLSPSSPLIGVGRTATYTIAISPALPTAITLSLSSSNPDVAAVPLNPSIPAGQASAQFNVVGGSAGTATITAAVPALYGSGSALSNLTVAAGFEGDVSPRPNGDVNGQVTITDWNQVGRFIAGLDSVALGSEFQRADCAPRGTLGDGLLTARDWVQAGRYAAGLDPVVGMGGATAPATLVANEDSSSFNAAAASLIRAELVQNKSLSVGKDQQVIKLTAQGGENALSFSLMFQPSLWKFSIAELTDETAGATLIVNHEQAAEGRLGFMFAYPTGKTLSAGQYNLFTVTFEPVTNSAEPLLVGFGDYPTAREISDASANRLPSSFAADYSLAGLAVCSNVSAASFAPDRLAGEQIIAAFGSDLAAMVATTPTLPLPTSLAGTSVRITDSKGVERQAGLFFVSPGQINYLLPAGLAEGVARVTISTTGKTSVGLIDIATIAPSLFTANSDGQGLAAAVLLRIRADGSQSYEPVSQFDSTSKRFVAVPIEFGGSGEQLFLLLYGTGLRHLESRTIKAKVGDTETPTPFAAAAAGFAGLDQINLNLPRSLTGRGEVEIKLTIDDRPANTVKVVVR